jgi:hypothetical protein
MLQPFRLATDPIDVYKVDQAYWRSLWHDPPRRPGAGLGASAFAASRRPIAAATKPHAGR